MNLTGFFHALFTDWVALMSGIASVALTIIGFARKWEQVPRWAFWAAALVCFFVASARVWTAQNKKVEAYALNSDAPYIYLEYAPTQNGPSGFYLNNVGNQTALRVQINEIQVGGRAAHFGEVAAVVSGAHPATYSTDVELGNLLDGLEVGSDGRAPLTASVDYWAVDNLRQFRTTCVFDYRRGAGPTLVKYTRDLISH